jgi:hypothetical protein
MRKYSFQIGTVSKFKPAEDLSRRVPAQIHIDRETRSRQLPKRPARPSKPVTFGKRNTSVMRTRGFSLAGLTGLFQGPRNTRRTNAR